MVVNKLDRVPAAERAATMERFESRIRPVNPHAYVVGVTAGRIDPTLLYDIAAATPESGQLSFRELLVDTGAHDHDHTHADSVTVVSDGCVDPDAVIDLLEEPPAGVYRMKGTIAVRYRASTRRYTVNVVGPSVHIAVAPAQAQSNSLVAIGMGLDTAQVRDRMRSALTSVSGPAAPQGIRRLQRYRRLSI